MSILPVRSMNGRSPPASDLDDDAAFLLAEDIGGLATGDRRSGAWRGSRVRDGGEFDGDVRVGRLEGGQDLLHRVFPLGVVAPHGDLGGILGEGPGRPDGGEASAG